MDQHTGGKWLIHGTKHRKDNQSQSLYCPVEYPSRECKHDIKESEGNRFNQIFKENAQGRKHPAHFQNQNNLVTENLKWSSKGEEWP